MQVHVVPLVLARPTFELSRGQRRPATARRRERRVGRHSPARDLHLVWRCGEYDSLSLKLHSGYLVNLAVLVVGSPLTRLLAVLEIARAHLGAILSEPLPVTGRHSVDCLPCCPNTAVLVVLNMLLRCRCLGGHSPTSLTIEQAKTLPGFKKPVYPSLLVLSKS